MAVYTDLLAKGLATAVFNSVIYTDPNDGRATVVRCVTLINYLASTEAWIWDAIGGSCGSILNGDPQHTTRVYDLRNRMPAGGSLTLVCASGQVGYWVTGYRLS